MRSIQKLAACLAILSGTAMAQQANAAPGMISTFRIAVTTPEVFVKGLPGDQIKNDMELILRRNGIGIAKDDDNKQVLQVTFTAETSEDQRYMAVHLSLALLVPGYSMEAVVTCRLRRSAEDDCLAHSAYVVTYWSRDQLLILGPGVAPDWQLKVRQGIKDLTESFALYYLRDTQKQK